MRNKKPETVFPRVERLAKERSLYQMGALLFMILFLYLLSLLVGLFGKVKKSQTVFLPTKQQQERSLSQMGALLLLCGLLLFLFAFVSWFVW